MKQSIFAGALAAAVLASAPLSAQSLPGEFSGNVAITSDYVYRGFTQTSEEFAVQGGLDWDSGAGFYVGVWGSNLNFGPGDPAHLEVDIYAGYANSFDNGFSYDVGFLYYLYPGDTDALDYDFWEAYLSFGYEVDALSFSAGVAYTPDNFGGTDDGVYFNGGVGYGLTDYVSVDANIGYWSVDDSFGDDYADWNIGATFSIPDWFDFDVRYFDTDLGNCDDLCDSRFVGTISRSF